MRIVGITGSIGCGKTMLSSLVKNLGYVVYDVDKWCRGLYYRKDFLEKIKEVFPQSFENDKFNKRLLRNLVFSDKNELKKLESMTHPFLIRRFHKVVAENVRRGTDMFLDIALLYEMGLDKYCTDVIVADVSPEIQKERVMKRDHISEKEFEDIVSAQIKNADKIKNCDFVINTDKSVSALKVELIKLIRFIKC